MTTRAIRVTVLVENTAAGRGLLSEHGLAFWIEAGSQRLLFDTGQGLTLAHNARRLGIRLESVEVAVLSHGHHDHAGGLADVLKAATGAKVCAHPAAFHRKYVRRDDGTAQDAGIRPVVADAVRRLAGELCWTDKPTQIGEGLWVTGEVPRLTDFENTGGRFFLDRACRQADALLDDQAVFFESSRGIVVLLGCAHAGVINTLRYVRELTGGKPIHAVMGGMHLVNATPERIDRTAEALGQLDVARLGPAHCTGADAAARLWYAFPGRCYSCSVGTVKQYE